MGKNQLRLLKFAIRYTGWHGYAIDAETDNAVKALVKLELLKVNKFRQFSLNQNPVTGINTPACKGVTSSGEQRTT